MIINITPPGTPRHQRVAINVDYERLEVAVIRFADLPATGEEADVVIPVEDDNGTQYLHGLIGRLADAYQAILARAEPYEETHDGPQDDGYEQYQHAIDRNDPGPDGMGEPW